MESLQIENWISGSFDLTTKEYRESVHTLMVAISNSATLYSRMIIKGGILLGIQFGNERHTEDIDFSTQERYEVEKEESIIRELKKELITAVENLDYGLDLQLQHTGLNPNRNDVSFPTLEIKIGYAYKGSKKHRRLMRGVCPTTLSIDYSFNEINSQIDTLEVKNGGKIKAYSIVDLVAEKYRAIIQQTIRNRSRRQDAYDIYRLLEGNFLEDISLKPNILASLKIKAHSRDIKINQNMLDDVETRKHSEYEYEDLRLEIEGELPPFEYLYSVVTEYYKSLPWRV